MATEEHDLFESFDTQNTAMAQDAHGDLYFLTQTESGASKDKNVPTKIDVASIQQKRTFQHFDPVSRRLTLSNSPRQDLQRIMDEDDDKLDANHLVINLKKKRVQDNYLIQKLRMQIADQWLDACVEKERE